MTETHLEDLADRIRPRTASNLLLWIILGFIALFVIWASVVKLDRTIHAAGRVVPSSRLQVVSNLEGGIVSQILVHAGDAVRAGQPLVRLDQTATGAELGSSEITVAALTAKIARLEAEIAGRDPVYPAPANAAVADQIGVERALHAARMSDLASLSSAASAREAQASRAVAEAQAAYQSKVTARDSADRQLEMIRPLVERGIEPQMTLVQLQSSASVAASDAAQASAGIARAQSAVAEARASLAQVRQGWRAQAGTDLTAAQAEMAARRRNVPMLADKVRRSVVTAPVAGHVNRVLVSTVGASIAPGAPIAEVVPSADALTVEASVSPKDIASVRIGQRAKINVTAYESAIYGGMEGRVVTISPDATVDEKTGESHYTVRVRGDADTFRDRGGHRLQIGPGMTADVNLLGDQRSVMAYIFTPIARLNENALRE
ncbi:MAG: HlyD family type I secretion periplasmic adaptor subunit [Janthinobacterium lividum]